jgi:hypothetical protein
VRTRGTRGNCAALPALALLTLLALAPVHADAATVQGVRFEDRVVLGEDASLDLCAAELLRYKRIFRGYVAALYLEDCGRRDAVLADAPRRLELSYFWSIPGSLFGSAAEEVLARNLSPAELAALRDRLEALHAKYRDVDPGDRYALTYRPGVGTELSWNGNPLVTVPGEDFARAYFAIWLGDEPLDADLRDRLLDGMDPLEG